MTLDDWHQGMCLSLGQRLFVIHGCSLYEGEATMTGALEAPGGWLVACNYHPMAGKRRCNRVSKSTGLVSMSAILSSDLQAMILIHPDGFNGE